MVRPEFWMSEDVASLSDVAKLVFIGTWNLADDAGLFRWKPGRIAAELFMYERDDRRRKKTEKALGELTAHDLVRVLDCGRHALVVTLTKYQLFAGPTRRVYTFRKEHESECVPQYPAGSRGEPEIPDDPRDGIGRVEVGSGKVSQTRERANGKTRDEEIDSLRTLIADPTTAEVARHAARRQLERLGATEGDPA